MPDNPIEPTEQAMKDREGIAKLIQGGLNNGVADYIADALLAAGYTLRPDVPRPVEYPDRDELAFELFNADNSLQDRNSNIRDYLQLKAEQKAAGEKFYVEVLADVAIAEFRRLNRGSA